MVGGVKGKYSTQLLPPSPVIALELGHGVERTVRQVLEVARLSTCDIGSALHASPVPAHAWSQDWPAALHRQCEPSSGSRRRARPDAADFPPLPVPARVSRVDPVAVGLRRGAALPHGAGAPVEPRVRVHRQRALVAVDRRGRRRGWQRRRRRRRRRHRAAAAETKSVVATRGARRRATRGHHETVARTAWARTVVAVVPKRRRADRAGRCPPGVVTAAELVGELYASASAWKLSMSVICARAAALQSNPVPAHAWSHDWPLLPHRQCGASGAEGGGDGGEHRRSSNTQISSSRRCDRRRRDHGVMRDDV